MADGVELVGSWDGVSFDGLAVWGRLTAGGKGEAVVPTASYLGSLASA